MTTYNKNRCYHFDSERVINTTFQVTSLSNMFFVLFLPHSQVTTQPNHPGTSFPISSQITAGHDTTNF